MKSASIPDESASMGRNMTVCRLLIDAPASGAWNMAVDEVLWEWCGRTGGLGWRFYQWEEPTLSLGYFQPYEDRWQDAASRSCSVVRRLSGGGAIVHDAELTYAMVVPWSHARSGRRQSWYRVVHATLVEALATFGVGASLGSDPKSTEAGARPFLCFQRRSPGDILVGSTKIAGSAQRRSQHAMLQHGSVLLARSEAAPTLDGLKEIAGVALRPDDLANKWLEVLARRLNWSWVRKGLSLDERRQAALLAATKYGTDSWTVDRHR